MNAHAQAVPARPSHIDVYLRVLNALVLRDMRSRFGGSYWGYLVQVLWPVVHVIGIVTLMTIRHVPSPMGDSTMIFIASGMFPLLAFKYISRSMMQGYGVHKALTYFPQVKRFDTIVARGLVEICSSFMGVAVVSLFLLCCGHDPIPVDITTAMTGYIAAIALGISIGLVNVGIVSVLPFWAMAYMLLVILLYLFSGVMFMACYLPPDLYALMRWNPLLQIIEWVRLGYEPNLPIEIDYFYIFGWIFGSLFVGLILERYVVRRQH